MKALNGFLSPVGEDHHSAKLTAEQVRALRALAPKGKRRAWRLVAPHVSWTSAQRAMDGYTWKHLQ